VQGPCGQKVLCTRGKQSPCRLSPKRLEGRVQRKMTTKRERKRKEEGFRIEKKGTRTYNESRMEKEADSTAPVNRKQRAGLREGGAHG